MVANPMGNRVYKLSCDKCEWEEQKTVAMGPLGQLIRKNFGKPGFGEKLLLKMKLPSKCPKCGGKIDVEEVPVFF